MAPPSRAVAAAFASSLATPRAAASTSGAARGLAPTVAMGLPAALAVVVALVGASGCNRSAKANYVTELASRGVVRDLVTATGQVEARVKVNVGSQVSGTLQAVHVTWNDTVKAGDVLAELDPRLYAAQLARAEASVQVAEASVAKARVDVHDKKRTHLRVVALHANALVAQADLEAAEVARDQAVAALAGAAAALTQAQADRDQAQANLAFTKIKSPIDGVVLDRQVDAGQTVAAQFQVATLFVIAADMHQVQVVVSVDEADVGKLRAPLAAEFRVAAYPQRTFAGNVVSVRPAPTSATGATGTASTSSSAVVTYAAVVEANNPNNLLRQGMTAELSVVVEEAADVVRVPAAALRWTPGEAALAGSEAPTASVREAGDAASSDAGNGNGNGNGKPAADAGSGPAGGGGDGGNGGESQDRGGRAARLFVLEGGAPKLRAVEVGLSDGQYVAVVRGLAAGEAVVVADDAAAPVGKGRGRAGL